MIDIKMIRENPDIIENDLKKRGNEEKLKQFQLLVKIDKEQRDVIQKVEKFKHERNVITIEIQKTKTAAQKKKKISL
ncbi:MAG: serine--tRNA ligase, partial [Candidatus Aenigmatarchaeota archaeon]